MEAFIKIFLAITWLTQVYTAPRSPRLSLAEPLPNNYYYNINDETPGMYSFGYDVSDPVTGNTQYRAEERYANGTVTGSYGYVDPYGAPQRFRYIADQNGYRVYSEVTTTRPFPGPHFGNEPTESSVTWTRPPKPYKKKVFGDLVAQLGTLFTQTNFL